MASKVGVKRKADEKQRELTRHHSAPARSPTAARHSGPHGSVPFPACAQDPASLLGRTRGCGGGCCTLSQAVVGLSSAGGSGRGTMLHPLAAPGWGDMIPAELHP